MDYIGRLGGVVSESSTYLDCCVRIEIELVDGGAGNGPSRSSGVDKKPRTRVDGLRGA